ncbi:hypothetical protein [Corynebacterium sp.]|uniref:hypothetical protein n=1 Tax=Corynebacterium sp. TaxID=1720 RepID=UPI0037351635
MTTVLISNCPTLRRLLQRITPHETTHTYGSLAAAPKRVVHDASTVVFDESTASFMELYAYKDAVGPRQKLVVLTEKCISLIRCFERATVMSYPISASALQDQLRSQEEIHA